MKEKECVQRFVDRLAKAICLINKVPQCQLYVLSAVPGYVEIVNRIDKEIDKTRDFGVEVLLHTIDNLFHEAENKADSEKYMYCKAICICMDKLITYVKFDENAWTNGRLSLNCLLPIESDLNLAILTELNSNKRESGICIIPKFPVSIATVEGQSGTITKKLNSRDAMYGLNGILKNICYYPWNDMMVQVHHIILPERSLDEQGKLLAEETRIAYTPLSDRKDILIQSKKYNKDMYQMPCSVVSVEGIKDETYIEQRFAECWLESCKENIDIFFAPEMLATKQMIHVENNGSTFLRPLLKQVVRKGLRPPRLTIMPSYWKDGRNSVFVFDEQGRLCGIQDKAVPFVNEKDGWVEALDTGKAQDVLLIHMIGHQRIAIVLCAEFLVNQKHISSFLCEQLGATLMLVPSYSLGEQDFLNTLAVLKPYGTSVIWGNCCGAAYTDEVQNKRIIGGCSIAGSDFIYRMGNKCICNHNCKDSRVCYFVIQIPRKIRSFKPNSPEIPEIVHHYQ